MTVLVASVLVAAVLAWQAMVAGQQRRAVSDAMVRQYAQLAGWEFAREAGKDIEVALTHTLADHAHPERHTAANQCECAAIDDVELWFEMPSDGPLVSTSPGMSAAMRSDLERLLTSERGGRTEGAVRIAPLSAQDVRLVAMRWEPPSGPRGRHIGLVMTPKALAPILAKTRNRVALLPPLLVAGRDARTLVDLTIRDGDDAVIFASDRTAPGSPAVDTPLIPAAPEVLRVTTAMTPAFVAGLGPEHGAGLSPALVVSLVVVNVLLVAVGLWQLARERELARLRSDFVAGVSHELRTPLAQIRMFAETLLLDRIRTPHEGRRALEIIGQETRRLSQLVENVLYFHRHQRVPLGPSMAVVDLATLVPEVVDGLRPLAGARRTRLEYVAAVAELSVHASADGLRQVVLNLLDNAVKFGPPGQVVRVRLDLAGGVARVTVEDQGPGIPAADRRRIFHAFERGRETRGTGGAGIGLAVVSQIVEAHGGRVTVESADTRGARFVVTLAAAAETTEAAVPVSLAG